MDKKQNTGNSSRRVTTKPPENKHSSAPPVRTHKRTAAEMEEKIRYGKQQKQKRVAAQRRRALIAFVICIIIVIVLMFMTPIFNIQEIAVKGNEIVKLEEIEAQIGDMVGENLFKTSAGNVRKKLKVIPYIDTVTVTKRLIRLRLNVIVTECIPAAYVGIDSETRVIDASLKILGDESTFSAQSLPNIIGAQINGGKLGETVTGENSEKLDILKTCLAAMKSTELLDKVKNIDITDITDIRFDYDERIDVRCGTQLDLDRKIRLFKETVSNNNLSEETRGTMDLSITGRAVIDQ